jgi:hypothetical protein
VDVEQSAALCSNEVGPRLVGLGFTHEADQPWRPVIPICSPKEELVLTIMQITWAMDSMQTLAADLAESLKNGDRLRQRRPRLPYGAIGDTKTQASRR